MNDNYEMQISDLKDQIKELEDGIMSMQEKHVAPLDIKCIEQDKIINTLREALKTISSSHSNYFVQTIIDTALNKCFGEKE